MLVVIIEEEIMVFIDLVGYSGRVNWQDLSWGSEENKALWPTCVSPFELPLQLGTSAKERGR